MKKFIDFVNIPTLTKDCLVFDFYQQKTAMRVADKQDIFSTLTSTLIRWSYSSFGKILYSREDEQAFFAAKVALCTSDNERGLCHLIRGIAATTCGEYQAAKADYNFALNYLTGTQVNVAACYVAHFNRAHACCHLQEYVAAVADYTEAGKLYNVKDVPLNGGGEIVSTNVNGSVYKFKDVLPVWTSEMTRILESLKYVALVGKLTAERNLRQLAIIFFSGVLLQDDKDFALSILFKDLFFETLSLIFYNSATDAGIKDIREYLFKLVYTVRTEVTEHDIICKFYSKLIKERETIMASAKEGRTVLQMDIYQFGNPSQATIKAINDTLSIVKIRVGEVESSSRNILTSLNFQPGTNSKPIGRRRMLIKPIEEDINDLPDLVWPEKDEQESDPLLNTTINYARPG